MNGASGHSENPQVSHSDSEYGLVPSTGPLAGTTLPLPWKTVILGSDPTAGIVLADPNVAPAHAEISPREDGALWIRDLVGDGRLWVNGERVAECRLDEGAFVKVGDVELCLRRMADAGPSGTTIRTGPPSGAGAQQAAPQPEEDVCSAQTATRPRVVAPRPGTAPGAIVGDRYRIVRKIGTGGMGEVYEAEHVELCKRVALKVMRQDLGEDQGFADRFRREAIAASNIGQKNICEVTDFGRTADGRFYFVMEYLDGETLAAVIRREGPMSSARVLPIVIQICRALGTAHQRGIIHRDLKPENILLVATEDEVDVVKVVDFGVAKVTLDGDTSGHTRLGMVVGTPQYMSPEQAAGLAVNHSADIYSLGLIIYEMLCGRPVFEGATPSLLIAAQIHKQPPPMLPGPVSVPIQTELEALVMRMLAKTVEARPQSMAEVAGALENLRPRVSQSMPLVAPGEPRSLQPTPATLPVKTAPAPLAAEDLAAIRPRFRIKAALLALGVVGVSFVAAYVLMGRAAAPPATLQTASTGAAALPPPTPVPPSTPAPPPTAETTPAPKPASPELVAAPPTPLPPVAEPARPALVKVTVSSRPKGALVFFGDKQVGRAPVTATWTKGEALVVKLALDHHEPRSYTLKPSKDTSLSGELKRIGAVGKRKPSGPDLQVNPYEKAEELKDVPY